MGLFSRLNKKPSQDEDEQEECAGEAAPSVNSSLAQDVAPPFSEDPNAPDELYAKAMNVDPALLLATAPALEGEEKELAVTVVEHFDQNRPSPTSFPRIAMDVLDLVRDPEVDVTRLARAVEQDPALVAGVLVLANSILFRGLSKIVSVKDAIARLGVVEVAGLVSALASRSLYSSELKAEFQAFGPIWNRLFFHAAATARAASDLARARRTGDPEFVFLGGMLHDVGKALALRSLASLTLSGKVRKSSDESIERVLHRVHVEVGSVAHEEWGLPSRLAQMAIMHHDATIPPDADHVELNLVRLVSALLLHRQMPALHPDAPFEALKSARALRLGPDRVGSLFLALGETEEWVNLLFADNGGPSSAPERAHVKRGN